MKPTLAIHGGAWNIPDEACEAHLAGIKDALSASWQTLVSGSSALDAVEIAVKTLEANPTFDAGKGARLNRAGKVELDASIMDGKTLASGAVGAVQGIRHPITLARRIMEHSEHVLLVGSGAKTFAKANGIPTCSTRDLLVGRELDRYERVMRGERDLVTYEFREGPTGTVGAIARDRNGNLAAATSTGGIQDKHAGRVGDTALPGAGTYADNQRGAASCTGHGEAIIKMVLAKSAIDLIPQQVTLQKAASSAVRSLRRVQGFGGLILMDRTGRATAAFNTPRMARGFAVEHDLQIGIERRMYSL